MRRLLPLLCFALLPAAVAAPVPPGKRPEFAPNGLVTADDLGQVRFDTRPLRPGDPVALLKEKEPAEEARKGGDGPRPENRYDLAVHMPWKHFLEGESIPAYFVLRNNRGRPLSLDARLSLFGPEPTLWNSCGIDVREKKTGKEVDVVHRSGFACGGGGLVDVPADGYYCVKGNLGRTFNGNPLPPGEYEVEWRYGLLRSAPCTFTVGKADGKIPPAAKRKWFLFYRIKPSFEDDDEDAPGRKGDSSLESIHAEDMASALAAGEHTLVPDIHTIPKADKLVEVSLDWKPHRDADRIAVTLHARPPHKQVAFDELPHLHLQVEVDSDPRMLPALEEKRLEKLKTSEIMTPLTLEVRLPAGWRDRGDASGPVRVAVLMTATEVELPTGALRKKLQEVRKDDPDAPPVWRGVLRTDFVELRLPPALPPRP